MKKLGFQKWSALCAGIIPLFVLVGCGGDETEDATGTPSPGASSGGSAGSTGGSSQTGGKAGSTTSGGSSQGGKAGGTGGMTGDAGKGGTSSAGQTGGGAGGESGGAGGDAQGGAGGESGGAGGDAQGGAGGDAQGGAGGDTQGGAGGAEIPPDCVGKTPEQEGCGAPADNATCANAQDITDAKTATGKTNGVGTTEGSCGGGIDETTCGNPGEAVFKYTVKSATKLSIQVTTNGDTTGQASVCDAPLDAVVYVRQACGDGSTELACNDAATFSSGPTLTDKLEPGDYFIFVDGYGGDVGEFTITVEELPPCTDNSSCTDPAAPACDVDSGNCVECVADADCASNPDGLTVCDTTTKACKAPPCTSDADCKDATNPACLVATGECVGCTDASHCAANEYAKICDTAANACVECSADGDCKGNPFGGKCDVANGFCTCDTDTDCADSTNGTTCYPSDGFFPAYCGCGSSTECASNPNGSACDANSGACGCASDADCASSTKGAKCGSDGACVECASSFDCADPTKPACVKGACAAVTCAGDDSADDADDGPVGATDITPTTGDTSEITTHKLCGTAGEGDWYKFTASDGDDVTLTLSWTEADPSAPHEFDVYLVDDKGDVVGIAWYQNPNVLKATYLPAGTYYVQIAQYPANTDEITNYTLGFSRTTGNKCATAADCASEYETQFFRGSCNATSGACERIDGKGAVADGALCDSGDDCTSGSCSYFILTANADTRSFCTKGCADSTECDNGTVCTSVFQENFCVAKCTKDIECIPDVNSVPASGTWAYLVCDAGTGDCSLPAAPPSLPSAKPRGNKATKTAAPKVSAAQMRDAQMASMKPSARYGHLRNALGKR